MAKHGRTIFILETRFGNDGYAALFKTLEILSAAENHTFDCRNVADLEYFFSVLKVDSKRGIEIIDELARLEVVDRELWQKRVLWSDKLLEYLGTVYEKRRRNPPKRPVIAEDNTVVFPETSVSVPEMPQREVEKRKEKQSRGEIENDGCDKVLETWNAFAETHGIASVIKLSDKRRAAILARAKEPEFNLPMIFTEIDRSDFLKGSTGWKVDFDFVFCSANNYLKILEGKYRNGTTRTGDRRGARVTAGEYAESLRIAEQMARNRQRGKTGEGS